ncbi:MAG: DUF72 domain-containing protein [Candidatus Krumholzibacteriota bacterium]|jgi:uncharacterized protein YecE (DUF72 family)|nr:DUF72 domain-containing protein [Candidatus Krumholzibacteriota bacterium]
MGEKDNWRVEDDFVDEEDFFREPSRPAAEGGKGGAEIFVGTSGWSYKDWEGTFYAPATRPEHYLPAYAATFRTVEIDSTFYSVPRESVVRAWDERTPDGFVFAAKFPRDITHEPGGLDPDSEVVQAFLDRMALLGDKLGPLLLQFPPGFRPDRMNALRTFLEGLPGDFRYAVELRHAGWHDEMLLGLLADLDMAWVSGVGPDSPPVRPVTTDFCYLRWLGDRSLETFREVVVDRGEDLADWAGWIRERRRGLRRVFGYVNNHYSGHAPATARELLALLGQEPPLPPAERQGDLFD